MKHLKEGVVALCMERRELLTSFGAVLGTASLGGCLSQYEDIAGEAGETTTDEQDTTTDKQDTTEQGVTLADTSFEIIDRGCGQPGSEASVSFEEGDDSVGVTGTIPGANACYIAELADASYDTESGTLEVTVVSMQEEGADTCADCITEIDYEATVSFEGGLPASVRVVHEAMGESETVTTAESK
jgi:hypothetical protein